VVSLVKISKKIYEKNRKRIKNIKIKLHKKIALVIAVMQNFDCECRKKYTKMITDEYRYKLSILKKSNEKIKEFIKIKYMNIVQNLIKDFRIFSGSNFLIFRAPLKTLVIHNITSFFLGKAFA